MAAVAMQTYRSDLSDIQWQMIAKFFPSNGLGRPPLYPKRLIVNAILYVLTTGCQWDMLPHDYPPHKRVHAIFRKWCDTGLWEDISSALNKSVRVLSEKKVSRPSWSSTPNRFVVQLDGKKIRVLMVTKKSMDTNATS
jgi:putative transposase